jgi:hypothetical protein
MVLEDLFLFEEDTSGTGQQYQIPVEIVQDDVFPFRVQKDGGIFLYHVQWEPPADPGANLALIKNRRYEGDTTFVFQGKKYDAIVFSVKELVSYDQNGVLEQQYDGQEIYAKGLGLVYYRKKISDALNLRFRLSERYPMQQLEEKFRELYQPEISR